jgi:hypothetical protein
VHEDPALHILTLNMNAVNTRRAPSAKPGAALCGILVAAVPKGAGACLRCGGSSKRCGSHNQRGAGKDDAHHG